MFENENTTPVVEDEDALLPDGWSEGDDIFAEDKWTGGEQADAPAAESAQESEEATAEQPAAPTTEQADVPGEQAAADTAPTTAQEQRQPNKLKFKARVDRQDLDVEVDESELPTLYQKAQATDRYQARVAAQAARMEQVEQMVKAIGYDDLDAFLANAGDNYQRSEVRRLVGEGVHEEVARDMVARRFVPQQKEPPQSVHAPYGDPGKGGAFVGERRNDEAGGDPAKGRMERSEVRSDAAPARDFAAEIAMLKAARPDLTGKQLPMEVVKACTDEKNPKHLFVAYAEYEVAQQKAEADKLRRENEVLRQNAASAARAPVSGVTGGGATNTEPEDDFMKGFNSGF